MDDIPAIEKSCFTSVFLCCAALVANDRCPLEAILLS